VRPFRRIALFFFIVVVENFSFDDESFVVIMMALVEALAPSKCNYGRT